MNTAHEGKCRKRQEIQHVLHYFSPFTQTKKKGIWKLLLENIGFQSTTLELFLKKKPKKQKYVLKKLFERKYTICLFSHI